MVCYPPGASGTFITRLLDSLLSHDMHEYEFSAGGSCHYSESQSHTIIPAFNYSADQLAAYAKDKSNDAARVWYTHNPNIIASFKELFPAAKVLHITASTQEEAFIIKVNHCIKWFIEELSADRYSILNNADVKQIEYASRLELFDNIRNFTKNGMLAMQCVDMMREPDFQNITLFGLNMSMFNNNVCIDLAHRTATAGAIPLTYSTIIKDDADSLLNIFEVLLGPLSEAQQEHVARSLHQYVLAQNQSLFTDYRQFSTEVVRSATLQLKAMHRTMTTK